MRPGTRLIITDITCDAAAAAASLKRHRRFVSILLSGSRTGRSTMVDYSKFNTIEGASDSDDEKQTVDPDKAEAWLR